MSVAYPVHYHVDPPEQFTRLQLLIRVVAFCALGLVGLSFTAVFICAFLALPVIAAVRVSARGADEYLRDDAPWIVSALRWFAAACAWAGLITEQLPTRRPEETVEVMIETTEHPRLTPVSAMWRVVTGIPSAIVFGILGWIGCFVWLWAALSILVAQRVGPGAWKFLVGLQRWSLRLLAYQASLVDEYPPFAFTDLPSTLPAARTAT